jgi:creatinine amidohydrolase
MAISITRRNLFRSLAAAGAAAHAAAGAPAAEIACTGHLCVNSRKVLLWESTRKEFREALESGSLKAMIIPTGSTEQHNEHLAMIQDTASATLVAHRAALSLYPQIMVATPVAVGISPHWMDRKGTLSLQKETFLSVVFDICESLKMHGVKKILILNGHGGNVAPLRERVPEFQRKLSIHIRMNSYWDAYTPEIIRKHMESGIAPGHAAEFETSFAMAAFPERIHWEGVDYASAKTRLAIKEPASARQDEQYHNQAKLASTAKGEAMIAIAVNWVAGRLRQIIAEA